jgi:hypothetical protein
MARLDGDMHGARPSCGRNWDSYQVWGRAAYEGGRKVGPRACHNADTHTHTHTHTLVKQIQTGLAIFSFQIKMAPSAPLQF